jgi:hypothetical protein
MIYDILVLPSLDKEQFETETEPVHGQIMMKRDEPDNPKRWRITSINNRDRFCLAEIVK